MLDLYLLPLNLTGGHEEQNLPGLLAARPGKKTERSRANDVFVILVSLTGEPQAFPKNLTGSLHYLSSVYFRTRGSITSGLQAAAEELNQLLLKHNLSQPGETPQTIALVNMLVLRNDQLYMANAGPTHTILLNEDRFEDFHEPIDTGRGLGISRTVKLKFYRAQMQPNDLILLCANPAERWTPKTFQDISKISLDNLRRRLISQAGSDLEALLMQFKTGEGQIHFLKPRIPLPAATGTKPEAVIAGPVTETIRQPQDDEQPIESAPGIALEPVQTDNIDLPQAAAMEPAATTAEALPADRPQRPQEETIVPENRASNEALLPDSAPVVTPPARVARPKPVAKPKPQLVKKITESKKPNWKRKFADRWLVFRADIHKARDQFLNFAGRLLPGSEKPGETLSPAKMLMIAVIVPILVVAIATSYYLYKGRGSQHENLLQRAQEYAALAENETDPNLKLNHWAQTVYWLDKADEFGQSEGSLALRMQAESAIDSLDGIIRLDFKPILVDSFDSSINFTKIDSSITDIYLLDSPGSRVLRLFLTGKGYQVDPDFQCGSIPPVEELVDFVTLPPGAPFGSTVLATDSKGNHLYCAPDQKPTWQKFIPPDNFSWGQITHISLYVNNLFVLDPEKNGLWIIPASMDANDTRYQKLNFSEFSPVLVFTSYVPKLKDIIDIAANGEDVYLLHDDGQMTTCNTKVLSFGQTNCKDPTLYEDTRPGKETKSAVFSDSRFTHILSTQPPEPSLYVLDASRQIINQFSLQLKLRRQLRPILNDEVFLTNAEPTAFTVTNTREVFIAFGNLIYQATLP